MCLLLLLLLLLILLYITDLKQLAFAWFTFALEDAFMRATVIATA